MSGWSCPHQDGELCVRLKCECRPGRPGCVLKGKVVFATDDENDTATNGTRSPSISLRAGSEPIRLAAKGRRSGRGTRKRAKV